MFSVIDHGVREDPEMEASTSVRSQHQILRPAFTITITWIENWFKQWTWGCISRTWERARWAATWLHSFCVASVSSGQAYGPISCGVAPELPWWVCSNCAILERVLQVITSFVPQFYQYKNTGIILNKSQRSTPGTWRLSKTRRAPPGIYKGELWRCVALLCPDSWEIVPLGRRYIVASTELSWSREESSHTYRWWKCELPLEVGLETCYLRLIRHTHGMMSNLSRYHGNSVSTCRFFNSAAVTRQLKNSSQRVLVIASGQLKNRQRVH